MDRPDIKQSVTYLYKAQNEISTDSVIAQWLHTEIGKVIDLACKLALSEEVANDALNKSL